MSRTFPIVLVILAVMFPAVVNAGHCHRCTRPLNTCGCAKPTCGTCQMGPSSCNCGGAPIMSAPVQIVPQSTMYMRQERVVTMQPVTRTEIRREAQTVEVPVTVQRQVTVDEGGYQSVWVPKLVTKNVSETTTQRQVQYRDVAYQVTQNVAVAQTRLVPTQMTTYAAVPGYSMASSTPVIVGSTLNGTHVHTHADGHVHGEMASAPTPIPEPAMAKAPATQTPAAVTAEQTWTKVPARTAEAAPAAPIQLQSFESAIPLQPATYAPRAPSAATAWRAQANFARQ